MGDKAQRLFTIFALLVLILVIASFTAVVAGTFVSVAGKGEAALPLFTTNAVSANASTAMTSLLFIILAFFFGFAVYRRNVKVGPATIIGIVGIVLIVWLGLKVGINMTLKPQGKQQLTLQEIYAKCIPSVVAITAYTADDSGAAWGTGVVLSADGLIITNTHIIDGCDSVTVTLSDGTEYKNAQLIGADGQSDIAVLKINAKGLTPAEFGDSGELAVGDSVAAIGNPLSEELTGTMAEISGIHCTSVAGVAALSRVVRSCTARWYTSGVPTVTTSSHLVRILPNTVTV